MAPLEPTKRTRIIIHYIVLNIFALVLVFFIESFSRTLWEAQDPLGLISGKKTPDRGRIQWTGSFERLIAQRFTNTCSRVLRDSLLCVCVAPLLALTHGPVCGRISG